MIITPRFIAPIAASPMGPRAARQRAVWACAWAVCAGLSISPSTAFAIFTVDTTEDQADVTPGDGRCAAISGRCTLRAALEEANARAGRNRVDLLSGRYVLSLGELEITDDLVLSGYDPLNTVIDANRRSRVLAIRPVDESGEGPEVVIRGISFVRGLESRQGIPGGGIYSSHASNVVKLEDCSVEDNEAPTLGGGVHNAGTLTLMRTSVTRNRVSTEGGGGFTFTGGGIYNGVDANAWIEQCVIDGNEAARGAGIANVAGHVFMINTTVHGNLATTSGGGIFNRGISSADDEPATFVVHFSTITANEANIGPSGGEEAFGGGVYNTAAFIYAGSILAANTDHRDRRALDYSPDCYAGRMGNSRDSRFISHGANVLGVYDDVACQHAAYESDRRGAPQAALDPGLDSFRAYMPYWWLPALGLRPDSPALDNVFATDLIQGCPRLDQRGHFRPADGNGDGLVYCDSGAFELNGGPASPVFRVPGILGPPPQLPLPPSVRGIETSIDLRLL